MDEHSPRGLTRLALDLLLPLVPLLCLLCRQPLLAHRLVVGHFDSRLEVDRWCRTRSEMLCKIAHLAARIAQWTGRAAGLSGTFVPFGSTLREICVGANAPPLVGVQKEFPIMPISRNLVRAQAVWPRADSRHFVRHDRRQIRHDLEAATQGSPVCHSCIIRLARLSLLHFG